MSKPTIRFKGYTDDWEQRKLDDISQDTFGGGTPKTSVTEYWNGDIPWIQSSDLTNEKLFGVSPKKYITEDAVKNSATKLIPANSITIVTRVGVGKLAFMPFEFTSSQDFLSLSNLTIDCNFGMYSIYKMLQRELNNIQGTSIKGITKADLLDKDVMIPVDIEEQQEIGQFFKQLDDTIALHQRKLELLKEQKKGFLQKMFPKSGQKAPEIRFEGFTDDWEQRKVVDITKFHKQGFYTKEPYGKDKKYYLLRGTEMTSNSLKINGTPKINATEKDYQDFKVEKGDFLIVRSGTVGTYGIVYDDIAAIFGSYLINFRFDMSVVTNEFFGLFYQSDLFKNQLNKIIQRSSNININAENIKSTFITLPNLAEQQKIGQFFKQLDDTIALHQRKLDKLKQMKQAFLQKMFV